MKKTNIMTNFGKGCIIICMMTSCLIALTALTMSAELPKGRQSCGCSCTEIIETPSIGKLL